MRRVLKISIIGVRAYPADFEGVSGIEVYLENVLDELANQKKEVFFRVYTRNFYQQKLELQQKLKEKVKKNFEVKTTFTLRSKIWETFLYSCVASVKSAYDGSDIVWYNAAGTAFFSFIPKIFGKKVALTVHGIDWERRKWNRLEKYFFKKLTRLALLQGPRVFAVSKKLKMHLGKIYKVKSIYSPPGIRFSVKSALSDIRRFDLQKYSYLIYLGRVVPEKRLEWLIEEFLNIKKDFKNLKLVVAGGHGNLPEYEEKLKKTYKDKAILWVGYIFGREKQSLLTYCKAFVLPSELEGNPVSLTEALGSQALSLVSEEVAAEFPKLRNILVFKSRSRRSFSKMFTKAVQTKRVKYTKSEKEALKKMSWRATARLYLQEFERMISG